jgi:hypothetical protein
MKLKSIILLCALLLAAALGGLALAQSGGSYDVEWQVIGSAGDEFAAGGAYQLGFTLGQDQEPLVSTGGSYQIVQEYWSGGSAPTAVKLVAFGVEARGDTLVVFWETATERDNLGFHLYRSDIGTPGSFSRLNETLIPSQSPGGGGAQYEWVDTGIHRGRLYFYLLEDIDMYGLATPHGPVTGLLAGFRAFMPLVTKGPQ